MVSTCGFGVERAWKEGGKGGGRGGGRERRRLGWSFLMINYKHDFQCLTILTKENRFLTFIYILNPFSKTSQFENIYETVTFSLSIKKVLTK